MERVALIGLGTMGSGMAGRLLRAGFPLTVYNRNPERATPFAITGASVALSPRQAAGDADVVISMVADDSASRRVWLDPDGALAGAKAGAVLMECSTLSPVWVRELCAAVKARGCEFLDAPVTGSKVQAADGELRFLVGGDDRVLTLAVPVLRAMGRDVVHMGPTGSGALMKLINNFLCGVQAASLAEALAWVERSGLNCDQALEILRNGAPGSPLVKLLSSRMERRDYTTSFALQLMQKDLAYALQESQLHDMPLTTAAAALQLFAEAVGKGWGQQDLSAVVESLRR